MSYATAGAGHRRAAEAIAQALRTAAPSASVECLDVLALAPSWIRRAYPGTYYVLIRRAGPVWGTAFSFLDHREVSRIVQPWRRAWNRLIGREFLAWVRGGGFDAVVATHFLPADLFAAAKEAGWLQAPSIVVVTDLHPHWLWLRSAGDLVVVATEQSAAVCEARGVPRSRLRVIGIPTARAFREPVDRLAVLGRLGLEPGRRTVLVTSGGTTVGPFARVVEWAVDVERLRPGRLQLVVVCGEDRRMARRLEARLRGAAMPTRVLGFVEDMAELMGASDLVVAKAGGLTLMEALAEGLPLILYHAIPGQERMNAQYVVRHGAAIAAASPQDVAAHLVEFADNPHHFEALRVAARALSRPGAAEEIARQVIAAGGAR